MTTPQLTQFQGQPAIEHRLPGGDRVVALLHGAQVVSWRSAGGIERLYLSPQARLDGHSAVRGGIPVCFPQFNQRGPLVKHGFARQLAWQLESGDASGFALALRSGAATQAFWPESFHARLALVLRPGLLRVSLRVRNTGQTPWSFTAALHSYLRVADAEAARLHGLQGAARWDALRDLRFDEADAWPRLGREFDSVYQLAPGQALRLESAGQRLAITQSASCPQTVVWNPGPELSLSLADLPDDGWRQMLCVEAASIDAPVTLAPGAVWEGWQQMAVVPS